MRHRQTSVLDILVSFGCVILLSASVVSCGLSAAREHARITKDQAQLRSIQLGCEGHAEFNRDRYPTPSLVARHPVNMDGKEIHVYGSGAPDYSQDTSANLMSYLIMQSYLWQDACVSPLENHPSSQVYEQYNFEAYLPNPPLGTAPVHWDSGLLFDPSDVGQPLHASYANVVLCDNRVRRSWTTYGVDPSVVMFGSRGPAVDQGVGYDRSPTLRFIEPKSGWNGNVVLADSSVLTMNSPFVTGTNDFFDFLFASDDSVADDQWLGVTVSSSADCQAVQTAFDPLRN